MPGCRRGRTCSTASARSCCCATSSPTLPLIYHCADRGALGGFVRFINRAKDELVGAGRVRCLRRRGAARVRGAIRELRCRRRPARRAGQPRRRFARSAARTRGCARTSARRAAARRPTTTGTPSTKAADREARRTRRRHWDRRAGATRSTARTTRGSMPWRRPTSSMAPRSRSLRLTEMAADLPRLRGRARAPRRPRLRRADRRRHDAVQDAPERPAPLAAPVPLHPGRRVPGRQRRPDRADRAARPDAGPARQRHGRRRRRPVDLPVPGRQLRRVRRVRCAVRAAARARPRSRRRPARRRASGSSRTSARCGTS